MQAIVPELRAHILSPCVRARTVRMLLELCELPLADALREEEHVWLAQHQHLPTYTRHARRICFNIICNPALRGRSAIVALSDEEMAAGTLMERVQIDEEQRRRAYELMLKERYESMNQGGDGGGIIRCRKCGSSDISWQQKQTRGADEVSLLPEPPHLPRPHRGSLTRACAACVLPGNDDFLHVLVLQESLEDELMTLRNATRTRARRGCSRRCTLGLAFLGGGRRRRRVGCLVRPARGHAAQAAKPSHARRAPPEAPSARAVRIARLACRPKGHATATAVERRRGVGDHVRGDAMCGRQLLAALRTLQRVDVLSPRARVLSGRAGGADKEAHVLRRLHEKKFHGDAAGLR